MSHEAVPIVPEIHWSLCGEQCACPPTMDQDKVVYVIDAKTLKVLFVNQAFEELWGTPREQLYKRIATLLDIMHPEDRPRMQADLAAGLSREVEYRIVRPDGQVRWIRSQRYHNRGADGKVANITGMAIDITEARQAQEHLKESERHFRTLIENALDIITEMETDGTILYTSPSCERVLGYPDRSLHGTNAFDLIHPDDRPAALELFQKALAHVGELHRLEFRILHHDGTWRYLEAIGNYIQDPSNGKVRAIINSRDVTERRQMQESINRSEKMATLGLVSAGVAHEINNPLSTILGFAECESKAHPKLESLQYILKEARRCQQLVKDLLSFSRDTKPGFQRANLKDIVESTLTLIESQAKVRRVKVVHQWADPLPMLMLDPNRIQQVVMNLCTNAMDAMHDGGTLTIKLHNPAATNGDAPLVRLEVTDTGVGIPADVRDKIFEPFFSTKDPGRGTGLGLSLVFDIVQKHGGTLEVESEVGRGSTFTVSLPIQNN